MRVYGTEFLRRARELCDEDGKITPLYVVKDGKRYAVDKVMSSMRQRPKIKPNSQ